MPKKVVQTKRALVVRVAFFFVFFGGENGYRGRVRRNFHSSGPFRSVTDQESEKGRKERGKERGQDGEGKIERER